MLESNHQADSNSPSRLTGEKRSKATKKVKEQILYSPKKVAAAIGVSESSLKRWCDAGVVKAVKTAGGHRRIAKSEVVAFAKRENYVLRDPRSVGLPDISTINFSSIGQAKANFLTAMLEADSENSNKILCSLFVRGHNIADILDRVVLPVFFDIGEMRENGRFEVYHERMATQICHQSLMELKTIILEVDDAAPTAIGCSLGSDPHLLTTLGVELCLRNIGWNATSLGADMSADSVLKAVVDLQPSLVWVSATLIDDPASFINKLKEFFNSIAAATKVVVGGPAIDRDIRELIQSAHYCEDFAQLVLLARNQRTTPNRDDQ